MTAPITPDERAYLRALANDATEGPWSVHDVGSAGEEEPSSIVIHTGKFDYADVTDPDGTSAVAWMPSWDRQEHNNADFIAAARAAVPRLLDALDTAEAEVARLTPPCDGGCSYGDGPAEECSAHGRPVAEVWGIVTEVQRQRDEARAEAARLRAAHDLIASVAASGLDVRESVATLEALAARPAPVWDEEAAWREAVRLYPTEHVGYDRPVPSDCQCDECYRRETQRDAYVAGRLAVVREHLPVRPDRETLIEAMSAALHITTDRIPGLNPGPALSADTTSVEVAADAVLALWPGESRATVQAEALRDAAETYERESGTSNGTIPWLRARADRIEKGETR